MHTKQLIAYIEHHHFRAVEMIGGHILAEEQFAADEGVLAANGVYGPYWTVIEPTPNAVRDWLGY